MTGNAAYLSSSINGTLFTYFNIFQPNLPIKMPPLFSSAYTPIAAAGTPAQVKHVSRLLATQIHAVGLGPGSTVPPPVKVNKNVGK